MHVVATAGHVDHGKSTLVRRLTGMEPDRWAEEQRRGMTIDLGYAWTTLPSGADVAFVDVPGHEHFVTNMLAGAGPAPAVMLVVAADEGWMPQTEEHLLAVTALGVADLMLVVTKCDVALPDAVVRAARERLADAGYVDVRAVAVSGETGAGLVELKVQLDHWLGGRPVADVDAPVRLWVDRVFTMRGAGTVVTGTLQAGTVRVGDTLRIEPNGLAASVRGLQSLRQARQHATGTARVAVNLRGVDRADLHRGAALVTAGAWTNCTEIDVLVEADVRPRRDVVVHIGAAAVPARVRPLAGAAVRLRLSHALPLHIGDRLLLRDPATRNACGARVADLRPQQLRRRGDPHRIGASMRVPSSADDEVARRGLASAAELVAAGFTSPPARARRVGEHWVADDRWQALAAALVRRLATEGDGVPTRELARDLGCPAEVVIAVAADDATLTHADGRLRLRNASREASAGLARLMADLHNAPFAAPERVALDELGLDARELALACRDGLLVRLAEGVYLRPEAVNAAADRLASLPQPFTVAAARTALKSSRRVVVPLLEHLDAARRTRRLPDGTRCVVTRSA